MSAISLIILFFGAGLGLSVGLIATGSVLAVPLLIYGAGLDVHRAVCVAMLTMTLLGFIGSIQKLHEGAVNVRPAAVIAFFGALFAPLGAWINKQLSQIALLVLFALVVLTISIHMLLQPQENTKSLSQSRDVVRSRGTAMFESGAVGAIIGLLGGLLGISGGFIAVPILVTSQRLEMHRAVATSWAIVAVVSASATVSHFLAGQRLPFKETLLFVVGGVLGFEIAARVAQRFSAAALKRLFAGAVVIISIAMLARLLAG